ncbi:hypothetical protein WN943_018078 [Citrus x changshan-huyou]
MDTRGKSNAEFRNDVNEALARHESNFDQINDSLHKAEQYFEFKNIAPGLQVQLASFHLEGIALQWHRWLTKFKGPLSWQEFTKAMLQRFGPTDYEDPSKALTRLKQTLTLEAYQETFEKLSHCIDGLPENFLVGCFIAGPKDDIRLDVKIKQPRTLTDAIGVARLVEERNNLQKKMSTSFCPSAITGAQRIIPHYSSGVLGPPQTSKINHNASNSTIPFRRITNQEARERRANGLCYYCDEKFVPDYRCQRPQLFMIEDSNQINLAKEPAEPESEDHEVMPEVSAYAISGASHPQTFRVMGKLKNKPNKRFQVTVANQEQIECKGLCQALTISIQGKSITADFFVLLVAACHLILGVQWLETIGPIEMDYKQLTMTYKVGEETYTFQGLKHTPLAALSDKEFNSIQDGDWRFCVDYRALNSITIKDKYLIPVIDELLDELHGAKFFSKLDLRAGYHQIRVHDADIPKTAFRTHEGHYEFLVMPFGLTNALSTFQCLMDDLFRPYLRKFILVFFDDILVYSKTWNDHLAQLLDELHGAKFFSKLDLRAGYHQIRVHDADIPKTAFRTHEGHYEFLVMPFGLTNALSTFQCLMDDLFRPYLRKFILVFFDDILVYSKTWNDHLAHLRIVLSILQTNKLFVKETKCRFGVSQVDYLGHVILDQEVAVSPSKIQVVLEWPTPTTVRKVRGFLGLAGLPDFSQQFVIECDASGIGIGAVLTQTNQPIAYYSEALKGTILLLSTYEKEMLAVVKSIWKWRPYLLGKPFTVRTDQKSLKYLLEQRITTPAQARWLPKILGYDYKIEYKRGPENQAADSLSRVVEFQFMSISGTHADWWQKLQGEVQQDSFYKKLSHSHSSQQLTQRDGVWFKRGRIYLNPTSTLIPQVMADCHSSPGGGHFGFHKTLSRIKLSFWWPNLRKTVKEFIQHCTICQRYKSDSMCPAGLLQPLPIPLQIWTEVSMDFIEGLPSSNGYTVIMVVVHRLSKYAHFVALKHPYTAVTIAKAFVANVVRLHGIPTAIVSDRDKVFVSSFWQALFQLQGTKLRMSSSYHPQTDGQTEVVNLTLEQYLRSVYGIPPPHLLTYVPGTSRVQAVDEYLRDRDTILRELRHNLSLARQRMKSQADLKRQEVSFKVGDYVYLKLQPYRQTSVAFRASMKLAPRFFGPYQIIGKVGTVAYRLALPPGSQIHNVFHVSMLRKHLGPIHTSASNQLPPVSDDSIILPQPEAILDRRVIQKGKYQPKSEILVKWRGAPNEDATWENEWRFTKSYPDFILADKDPLRGEE